TIALACLYAKSLRVQRLFSNQSMRRRTKSSLSTRYFMGKIALICIVELGIVAANVLSNTPSVAVASTAKLDARFCDPATCRPPDDIICGEPPA
ncbi:hypothetical protein GUF51_22160, partial [Xanthomonas citri pv. citri]|nr:hypothetical protein [Xanthomonas citri pv. citri]